MIFELLPNEIILDLFEYLSFIQLFHGFFGLNTRFNELLCRQVQKFYLDLRLMSKTNFHRIFDNYLPSIIDRIISLRLSNDDETPRQIELFLSQDYQLRQFIHLQFISLSHLQYQQTLDRIMIECSYLPSLTHLTITDSFIPMSANDAERFFNNIWSRPKLTYFYLDINFAGNNYFPNSSVVYTSLNHLVVKRTTCSLTTFLHLCQHTPWLHSLSINFVDESKEIELTSPLLSITRLDILFNSSKNILQHLLQNMPNLYHLTLDAYYIYMSGYEWEEMITKYLSKLKIFKFKMKFAPLNNKDDETQWTEILDSFRTKFWIEQHQWFVRCHGYKLIDQSQLNRIEIFSLPYAFKDFPSASKINLSRSTCPFDDIYLSCDNVSNLYYGPSSFTNSIMSCIRFCYIQNLSLTLPFNDKFLFVVSKLDRLTSLYISIAKYEDLDNSQLQLQLILDRAIRLHLLSFDSMSLSICRALVMEITSSSSHQLDLKGYSYHDDWLCFDEASCIQFSHSPLGKQCQTLSINVKNRKNILDLVNNMPNLHALNIRCEDDSWTGEHPIISPIDDEFIEWLQQHLLSTCTIMRDMHHINDIRLWIR